MNCVVANMKIIVGISASDVLERIRENISEKNGSVVYNNLTCKDEFIGKVSGNSFWIQRTKPRYWLSHMNARIFKGTVHEVSADKAVIEGRFRFNNNRTLFAVLLFLISVYKILSITTGIKAIVAIMLSGAIIFGVVYGLSLISKLVFKREESQVIEFLKGLNQKEVSHASHNPGDNRRGRIR